MPLGAYRLSQYLANPIAGDAILDFDFDKMFISGGRFVASLGSSPRDLYFKDDGTILYAINSGDDRVYQYSLSTAWDIETASYANKFISVASQESGTPEGLAFDDTGTILMVLGRPTNKVFQYTLSTAWDISTATYASKEFSVNTQATSPRGLAFKPDGTIMYIGNQTNGRIYQYTLSTAWDISTATYDNKQSASSAADEIEGMAISKLGTSVVTVETDNPVDFEIFTLSTPWDISTSTRSVSRHIVVENITDLYISPNNKYMYTINSSEQVHKFINLDYGVRYIRESTSTTATISTSTTSQADDYAFLFDYSTNTTEVVPSGWTKISSITTTGIRTTISYKKLVSGDVNTTITGQGTTTNKVLSIYRPSVNSNITISSVNEQATLDAPNNQTLSISGESGCIIAFFVSGSTGSSTRTLTPPETDLMGTGGIRIQTAIYQDSDTPKNHTVSMTDGGANTLQSFWVKFTPV